MGLARIDRSQRDTGPSEGQRRVVASSPPDLMELRQVLNGIHKTFGKRHLDLYELICPTDRQWAIVRHQAFDIIEEEYRVLTRALTSILGGQEAAAQLEAEQAAQARKKA